MAVTKNVTVDEERSVALQFHDIMNLLRIHVNNPSDQLVKGVEVSLTNGTEGCVAGSACVEPTSSRHAQGEPELYSDLNIWCEDYGQ